MVASVPETRSIHSSVSVEHRLVTDIQADRQTDRQTPGHNIYLAMRMRSCASRGKNSGSAIGGRHPRLKLSSLFAHISRKMINSLLVHAPMTYVIIIIMYMGLYQPDIKMSRFWHSTTTTITILTFQLTKGHRREPTYRAMKANKR